MDFSEAYKCSGPSPVFSPDGRFIAAAAEYRLVIREAETLAVVQLYSCLDRIDHLEWSPNSLYIMCGLFSRAIIQVWAAEQSDWACKIDEGPAGVQAARWSPDGTAILLSATFNIRTTVWSLKDRRCHYLPGAKSSDRGIAFSPCGQYMAQLERYECRDHVSVYDTASWSQLHHFPTSTSDAAELSWSPDGGCVALLDGPLTYRVAVHAIDGRPLAEYEAYRDALGIKSSSWDPSGQFLAVGSYDEKLRVLNDVTWQPLLEEAHPRTVAGPPGVVVYREVEEAVQGMPSLSPVSASKSPASLRGETKSRYSICDLPTALPYVKPDMDQPKPKMGVGLLRWSPDSRFLASVSLASPGSVWIWDMDAGQLGAVLMHLAEVTDLQWAPQGSLLATVTSTSRLYMWAPAGASVVHIPLRNFQARGVSWSPHGSSFLLTSKDCFSCAYMAAGNQ